MEWTYPPGGGSEKFEGPLWIGDYSCFTAGPWTWLSITPHEPAYDNVRKARVDFSGFSFVIGFFVRFGS